jgi:hypothetical protein
LCLAGRRLIQDGKRIDGARRPASGILLCALIDQRRKPRRPLAEALAQQHIDRIQIGLRTGRHPRHDLRSQVPQRPMTLPVCVNREASSGERSRNRSLREGLRVSRLRHSPRVLRRGRLGPFVGPRIPHHMSLAQFLPWSDEVDLLPASLAGVDGMPAFPVRRGAAAGLPLPAAQRADPEMCPC